MDGLTMLQPPIPSDPLGQTCLGIQIQICPKFPKTLCPMKQSKRVLQQNETNESIVDFGFSLRFSLGIETEMNREKGWMSTGDE